MFCFFPENNKLYYITHSHMSTLDVISTNLKLNQVPKTHKHHLMFEVYFVSTGQFLIEQ